MCRQMSGPLRFLRFASVCAESRFAAGLISKDDLEKIRWHIQEGIKPEIEFLKRCFPDAAANITDWSYASVGEYWHKNHGHTGDCAVTKAVVCDILFSVSVLVLADNRTFAALNVYDIDLQSGDVVYLHKKTIIEKVEL